MSISALIQGTEPNAIPEPTTRPSIWSATRRLMLDPWVLTASILTVGFLLTPDLGSPGLTIRSFVTDYLSTVVLLLMPVIYLSHRTVDGHWKRVGVESDLDGAIA